MKKDERDLINRYIDEELSEDERDIIFSFINKNKEAYEYFKKLEILKNDLKEISKSREKIYLKDKILMKIRKEKTKRNFSLSLGFTLVTILILLIFIPFKQNENSFKISYINKSNHKYLISNIAYNSNVSDIEITLYVKDEKIDEKTGNLKIPKEEFKYFYETLNEKGDVVIEKIEGKEEKSDYINVKINYKNYPKKGIEYYLGLILPYFLISTIFITPIFVILKTKRKLI
jgi:hypothetical protein